MLICKLQTTVTVDTTSYLPEAKRGCVGVEDVGVVVYEARAPMS